MKTDFLSANAIETFGLGKVETSVRISRHALLLNPHCIAIGDYSRIVAFCIISASEDGVTIGRNVHISAYVSILGSRAVHIGDFATFSVRCSIFSSNDDYSGEIMANPTVPECYRGTTAVPVVAGKHAILGTGVTVLPGVRVGESSTVGAASLIKSDVPDSIIVAGIPARPIRERRSEHRILAEKFLTECLAPASKHE